MTSQGAPCHLSLVTSPGRPRSQRSVWFPRSHASVSSRRSPRSPHSPSPPALKDAPRSQSSRCSLKVSAARVSGVPHKFSQPEPQVLLPRNLPRKPCSLAPSQRVRCPLLWWAPAPGSRSAQGLGTAAEIRSPRSGVLVPGWVSDLGHLPRRRLYPRPAAWALPSAAPTAPSRPQGYPELPELR